MIEKIQTQLLEYGLLGIVALTLGGVVWYLWKTYQSALAVKDELAAKVVEALVASTATADRLVDAFEAVRAAIDNLKEKVIEHARHQENN